MSRGFLGGDFLGDGQKRDGGIGHLMLARSGEVLKDRGTLANVALGIGEPVKGQDVVSLLETQKEKGRLPLVWATDNGPAYKSWEVEVSAGARESFTCFPSLMCPKTTLRRKGALGS